jgi:hypothetical protein
VIVVDDEVAGTIGSWGELGEREVTYWTGRSYWGKGIATDALNAFLVVERSRPLHARVAFDNVASRRVLRSAASASSRRNEASLKRAQPRSRNSCCGSTSSLPRLTDLRPASARVAHEQWVNGVSTMRYSSLTLEEEFKCQQKRTRALSRPRMRLSAGATWRRLPR